MPDTAFYFALYRYAVIVPRVDSGAFGVAWIKTMRDGEVAIAARSHERVSEDIMDRLFMHCRETNLIEHREVIRDPFLNYWDGWNMAFAFDLCPCIEVYSETSKKHPPQLNWDYRVVTV